MTSKHSILVAAIFFVSLFLNAQWIPTGNLTIFSDDGSRFSLILNGEKYNDAPQTNIRVEELSNPYYSCKIIFEESAKGQISKNIQVTDANGLYQDVTYKIKPQSENKYVLRYYSMIPAEQNMMRPSNASVYRYGSPNMIIAGPGYTQTTIVQPAPVQVVQPAPQPSSVQTTTQQVVTTTNSPANAGGGANVNMNVGGFGVNMNVNVPGDMAYGAASSTTTTTTTTTTTSGNTSGYNENHHEHGEHHGHDHQAGQYGSGCNYAMNPADFESAKSTVSKNGFDDTRLSTAQAVITSNCMSSDQICTIMDIFGFEETKMSFAKYAYDYCVDQKNYFKVVNKFSFESSKSDLNQFIQAKGSRR